MPLQQRHAAEVADVLSEAFFDYPVMRFVLGAAGKYDERLSDLVALFVAARALRDGRRMLLVPGPETVDRVFRLTGLVHEFEWLRSAAEVAAPGDDDESPPAA